MKQPISIRIESDLLDRVKVAAAKENRTVTNYIENLLKERINNENKLQNRT